MKEQTLTIKDLQVNYKTAGEGPAVFILHGWGSSSGVWWKSAGSQLAQNGFCVYILDLPGFGASSLPQEPWGIQEYALFLADFLDSVKEKKIILAGHSFGGQIALRFAINAPDRILKLILLAPAAVRMKPRIKEILFQRLAKIISILLYIAPINARENIRKIGYKMLSRPDYVKTYGIMRDIFQRVIREDLTPFFARVVVPTFLVWGAKDLLTPLLDARIMEQNIPGSKLFIIPESGHNLHIDAPKKLIELITLLAR